MAFSVFIIFVLLFQRDDFSHGIKFSAESFFEISLLAEKGKTHLESLREKANVPNFGPCWKNAISNLQIGCKFLSENVQSDLALMFTDCFLQMSGHEPLNCDFTKSECLKKLSDRAFNAFTEFYTHTQSICYFLQSQVWHEETEKTINKLSSTSFDVSKKLEEAGKVQEKLLDHQKESLILQHDIGNSSKNIASVLQLSQDSINGFIKDFKSVTAEQKELLGEVFKNLLLFKSWAAKELSWFSSTVYFTTVTLISFLFTSVSRTREARMVMFIIFSTNYFFERVLISSLNDAFFGSNVTIIRESLDSWIWLCRKFFICLAVVLLIYTALSYCDYNLHNYKLLLEIKNQNLRILNYFDSLKKNQNVSGNYSDEVNPALNKLYNSQKAFNDQTASYTIKENHSADLLNRNFYSNCYVVGNSILSSRDSVDAEKNSSLDEDENKSLDKIFTTSEKVEFPKKNESSYNLRSNKKKTTLLT